MEITGAYMSRVLGNRSDESGQRETIEQWHLQIRMKQSLSDGEAVF